MWASGSQRRSLRYVVRLDEPKTGAVKRELNAGKEKHRLQVRDLTGHYVKFRVKKEENGETNVELLV